KPGTREQILATGKNLRSITAGEKTRLIVDDDPEIAAEIEADGVHLGQTDMPIPEARKRYPSLRIFGLSTHNPQQAEDAVSVSPDYCGVGPVFATPTKKIPDPTVGVETAGAIIRAAPFTTVAIGGINKTNLRDVLRAGAINFAVVRPVCQSIDPRGEIRRLQDIWGEQSDE
ncbi:MAG: thiamine phosphate synthase, partial [Kiritimatiellae bacterium]|nr:thiamine phosphate synthase [Kiritimatiellia bacterium]